MSPMSLLFDLLTWVLTMVLVWALLTRNENKHKAERARLERIVIEQQTQLSKLDRKYEQLQTDFAERGRVNARLNRELQAAQRKGGCDA